MTGALCSCILLLFVFKVPQESRDLLLVVLGALVAIVKDVFGFEFGSSKDSQRNAQARVSGHAQAWGLAPVQSGCKSRQKTPFPPILSQPNSL
jgi:hypothetical protein